MTSTSMCKRISSGTGTGTGTASAELIKSLPTTPSSSQGSSVICEEVFDEACFPSSEEINEYASLIGIELQKEPHLLYLAKEGLMAALPSDWKICYSEEKNGHYYHNTRTKESQWDHPLDAIYRDLVNQARQKPVDTGSVGDNDDLSQLDSGIRSMQGIDDIPSPGPLPLNNLARKWSVASKASVFSSAKSRFLDSGTKDMGRLYQLGFEVTKSKPQIANKPSTTSQMNGKAEKSEENDGGAKLSGTTVSMFQKAHRQFESDGYTSPSGVKGILRDSSITDISRRLDRLEPTGLDVEDKKSVRFNLDQGQRVKSSSNEETPSMAKMTQSYKRNEHSQSEDDDEDVVVQTDDDDDDDDDNDDVIEDEDVDEADKEDALNPWPDHDEGIYNSNPFLSDSNKTIPKTMPEVVKLSGSGDAASSNTKDIDATKLFYDDTDSDSKGSSVRSFIINKSEQDSSLLAGNNAFDLEELGRKHSYELEQLQLKSVQVPPSEKSICRASFTDKEAQLQNDFEAIRRDHEAKLKRFRHEYELRLTSHQHKLEEAFELQMENYRLQLERQLQGKRTSMATEHKSRMDTLQANHEEILRDLERELHGEEELLRREHSSRLSQLREKFARELDAEKQRVREKGEERLYEKVRCEKRLLEDKYRCLKEKYVRLKTDVKLSLERRNRRREAQMAPQQNHTNSTKSTNSGTEMERSMERSMERYYKPQSGNSDNRSLSYSDQAIAGEAIVKTGPVQHKSQLTKSYNIRQLQLQDDNTSISQSDTTLSNTYNNGRYGSFLKSASGVISARTASDNGNSSRDGLVGAVATQSNLERNNNSNQIKESTGISRIVFSRTKSASTSRLNSDTSYKGDRPCTPVENLRHQLQKLEALEDQFPENTLDAPYHLRYPFTDISIKPNGVGSELEFFKHRIHLERDSVRRAKESLRTQRTNFRLRQREIGQQRKITALSPKHSIDQLIQEEKELTEMEVNLHRTRSLLGEKIIRLRHLEQSLLRIYEKEKSILDLGTIDDAATLSDLSSHSSSGFSSTELASGADFHKKKDYYQQESNDCIENLEILNAEIREILDIFGQKQYQQQQHDQAASGIPILSPRDLGWSQVLKHQHQHSATQNFSLLPSDGIDGDGAVHIPHSIPTLADRLETYRQLAAGRMQSSMGAAILTANTIVSQSPRAVNYTTCLVERTRDLRNWLRQAKNEHDFLVQHGIPLGQTAVAGGVGVGVGIGVGGGVGGGGGGGEASASLTSGSASIINTTTTAGSSARGKNDI
ncbi:kinesin-related protein 4 [Drosophila santomea]|uniref:kinesin-related protein 4 n=1 Tax=Drosophila santomea TaxID=129105 RepID=UPI001952C3F3|nr:kinesin-related protein 4 [Drosophila santomea]XP_039499227.1 kinesin-related protein 4 [Drosophila santomea]